MLRLVGDPLALAEDPQITPPSMIGQTMRKKYGGKPSMPSSESAGRATQKPTAHFHAGAGSSSAESIAR